MCLPEPSLQFTIPSIYDDTVLDCRLYHPIEHAPAEKRVVRKRGAIIAHPYAPLGGCYDDPVVGLTGVPVLAAGFIICTFNFRGAYGSKGRTSWTGRPEREDYVSIVGFFAHYLHQLHHPEPSPAADTSKPIDNSILLVLGGYSYGSLIAYHLPAVGEILITFNNSEEGTAIAEIRSRAESLAGQRNEKLRVLQAAGVRGRNRGHVLAVGGEETAPEKRRRSMETRRSLDIPRILSPRRRSHEIKRPKTTLVHVTPDVQLPQIEPAYLLISPLLPPVSSFVAIPVGPRALKNDAERQWHKFSQHPSLAVFGDDDAFTSVKKLRQWALSIASKASSRFQFVTVGHAGHFWHDQNAQRNLKNAVNTWITGL